MSKNRETGESRPAQPSAADADQVDEVKGYDYFNLAPAFASAMDKLGLAGPPAPAGGRAMTTLGGAGTVNRTN